MARDLGRNVAGGSASHYASANSRRHYGAHAAEILQVKPGLAGLWQISGRNRLTYAERCRLDLRLVRERSVAMYCAILLRTLPEVFSGENSW